MNKNELKEKVVSYADKVFFYCIKRVRNRMDAEDLSQTILLEVIKNIDKGTIIENLDYYIWGVCKNQFNMYLRKTIKARNTINFVEEIDEVDDKKTILEALIEDEKIKRMNAAIKLLSKDYAEILYAYYVEDKTLKFIAESIKLPLGTVTWKLTVIRKKLKEYLDMEKLNGKKAYIPKSFDMSMMCDKVGEHDPTIEVNTLIHKNLLYHSYDNPCTIEDYAIELGISRPYIEEIVKRLEKVTLLKKIEKNKYVTNFVYLNEPIQREILNINEKYLPKLYEELKKYTTSNIKRYKSFMCYSDISEGKLMWSFMLYSLIYLEWIVLNQYEHTLRPGKGRWDFNMIEQFDYEKTVNTIGCNGYGNIGFHGWTYPSSCTPAIPTILQYDKALNCEENYHGVYELVKKLDEVGKYDENDQYMKVIVQKGIEEGVIKKLNGEIKINLPIIKVEDLKTINNDLKGDKLKKARYIMENMKTEIKKLLEFNVPVYLYNQIDYLISTTAIVRTQMVEAFTNDNLLDYEVDNDMFTYNGLFVYEGK